jgi:peptidoglycan/LPS O-acetylase OafA/YrhL
MLNCAVPGDDRLARFSQVTMTTALSLYLDALRFGAAFTVFLSHYALGRFSGGLFWQVTPYGRVAVLVFFVLSGFVIAWVTETREQTFEEYALSRAARLYSVILPAFLVTLVVDHLAMAIDPRLYGSEILPQMGHGPFHTLLGYTLSAVFLGESWTLTVQPGSIVPFWSLNYEAWYYVLFATASFLEGRRRIAALAAASLLAGPKILLLFPVWLMGVWAWRWRAAPPPQWGAPLVLGAAAGLFALEALSGPQLFRQATTQWVPPLYSARDYIVGALVGLFIVGLANARLPMPRPTLERLIRGLAGTTFGLYVLHYPCLSFFGTVVPGPPDRATHRILVFGLSLGASLALAHLIEQRKGAMKRVLRSGLDLARGKRLLSAFERRGLW